MSSITPFLWFQDQAEEAVNYYTSLFKDSTIENVTRYSEAGPGPAGSVMTIEFQLLGRDYMALNGGQPSVAGIAPIALFVSCETQAEVDELWEKLAAGGKILQCGWLVDKFGISWNIVPQGLVELLGSDDRERQQRAMKAMLQMEKLDINELRRAYEGVPG